MNFLMSSIICLALAITCPAEVAGSISLKSKVNGKEFESNFSRQAVFETALMFDESESKSKIEVVSVNESIIKAQQVASVLLGRKYDVFRRGNWILRGFQLVSIESGPRTATYQIFKFSPKGGYDDENHLQIVVMLDGQVIVPLPSEEPKTTPGIEQRK
jgi:hypothetical protein